MSYFQSGAQHTPSPLARLRVRSNRPVLHPLRKLIGIASFCLAGVAYAQNAAIVNNKPIPKAKLDDIVTQLVAQGRPDTPELRTAGHRNSGIFTDYPQGNDWHRVLAHRGWSVPQWPVEYGGTGWTPHQGAHQSAIQAAYKQDFFSESLFVRMQVLRMQGHWKGQPFEHPMELAHG